MFQKYDMKDLNLILSMKKIIILLWLLSFFACKSSKDFESKVSEKDYVFAYKTSVLYGCLNEITNNSFYQVLKEHNDLALAQETAILLHDETEKSVSLGRKYPERINAIDYKDYEGKKPLYSSCVETPTVGAKFEYTVF